MTVHGGCTALLIPIVDTSPGVTTSTVLRGIFETISSSTGLHTNPWHGL